MASDDDPDTLRQIARLLGVPTSAFYDLGETWRGGTAGEAARDSAELIGAFARISDPAVRRECIAFVKAKAHGSCGADHTPPVADQA